MVDNVKYPGLYFNITLFYPKAPNTRSDLAFQIKLLVDVVDLAYIFSITKIKITYTNKCPMYMLCYK